MPRYLVEIPLPHSDVRTAHRASITVASAQSRLARLGVGTRSLIGGYVEDHRLVLVVDAASGGDVDRMVALALLPRARVREVTAIPVRDGGRSSGIVSQQPACDLRPGVDAELVEDMRDVRLDGPL